VLLSLQDREISDAVACTLAAAGGEARLSLTAWDFLSIVVRALPGAPKLSELSGAAVAPDTGSALTPPAARQVLRTALVAVLLSAWPEQADRERLQQWSRRLGVQEPTIGVLGALAAGVDPLGLVRTVEFDAYRTPIPRDLVLLPAFSRVLTMGLPAAVVRGSAPDARLAALFDPLYLMPAGTAGRTFADFYAERGWLLPGVPDGVPFPLTIHDWVHVYIGATTEPRGEIEAGAFAAGNTRHPSGFHNLLTAVLVFEHGMVSMMDGGFAGPAVPDVAGARALSAEPGGGRILAEALLRGSRTSTDVYLGIDHLAHADIALDELRTRYQIPARGALVDPVGVTSRAATTHARFE
jgi:hypothetical protein